MNFAACVSSASFLLLLWLHITRFNAGSCSAMLCLSAGRVSESVLRGLLLTPMPFRQQLIDTLILQAVVYSE